MSCGPTSTKAEPIGVRESEEDMEGVAGETIDGR